MLHEDIGGRKEIVLYRLETAKERIKVARLLLESGEFKDANNRAYYAIFHTINAIHALSGKGYKTHKETLGNFNREFVKTEIFPRDLGRRVGDAEEVRRMSDYNDFYIASRTQALEQIETAEELLALAEPYCVEQLKLQGLM